MLIENLISKIEKLKEKTFTKSEIIKIISEGTEKVRPDIISGDVVICPERYSIYVNGQEHKTTKKIFELTYYLMSNKNKMMTKKRILNHVWGTEVIVDPRTVNVHVRGIRRIVGDHCIKTIKTQGYGWMENTFSNE